MNTLTIESLTNENRILRDQLNEIRYYLIGSRGIKFTVNDLEIGQTIYCSKSTIHHLASNLLHQSYSCFDIGPGLRPQRLLDCPLHILVEPYQPYIDKLVTSYPEKYVVGDNGLSFLQHAQDKSIDTIFLLDVIEHLEKKDGLELLTEATRVARRQIVIFTPLGFMPQHYEESEKWPDVEHGDLQNHLSGWTPEDFSHATHIVCNDYHGRNKHTFGAFYSIIHIDKESETRLFLISDNIPANIKFNKNDILISDIAFSELSWEINFVPKSNLIIVPLQLIAGECNTPIEILRNTICNFSLLEHYLKFSNSISTFGTAAAVVHQRYQNEWQ